MSKKPVTRRDFLTKVAQGTAVVAAGAPLWAYLLQQEARAMPYALRP
ncbi:MAG: twin-arginine translocation signal domain-containing protein, partial [Thiotrichales bacterium]